MAVVELIGGWEDSVTEPAYRHLGDVGRETTTAKGPGCEWSNATGDGGPDAQGCDAERTRSPPNWPVFLLFVVVIATIWDDRPPDQ